MIGRNSELFLDKCLVAFLASFTVMIYSVGFSYSALCFSILVGSVCGLLAVGSSILEFFTFGKNLWFECWLTGCLTIMADMIVNIHIYEIVLHNDAQSVLVGLLASIAYLVTEQIKVKFINT